jgi:DNA modification methylase
MDLLNINNMEYYPPGYPPKEFDLIFADYIYENTDFSWVEHYWKFLKPKGILIAMTDWHSAAEYKVFTNALPAAHLVNWIVWKNEFGNFPKNKFRQCHDDIIIFSKGKDYKFYPERVQVEKATAKSKGLNPSGRTTKLATSFISDICLTTIHTERVKDKNGKNVPWQKPVALLERIMNPFLDAGESVLDPFMGVGTAGVVAQKLGCSYTGIEIKSDIYQLAKERLENGSG